MTYAPTSSAPDNNVCRYKYITIHEKIFLSKELYKKTLLIPAVSVNSLEARGRKVLNHDTICVFVSSCFRIENHVFVHADSDLVVKQMFFAYDKMLHGDQKHNRSPNFKSFLKIKTKKQNNEVAARITL
jgi:hypothetical protein